jgi:hypothetical protein
LRALVRVREGPALLDGGDGPLPPSCGLGIGHADPRCHLRQVLVADAKLGLDCLAVSNGEPAYGGLGRALGGLGRALLHHGLSRRGDGDLGSSVVTAIPAAAGGPHQGHHRPLHAAGEGLRRLERASEDARHILSHEVFDAVLHHVIDRREGPSPP